MGGIGTLKALAVAQLDLAFQIHSECVVTGDYRAAQGPVIKAGAKFLVFPLHPGECDGVNLKPGDQKALVRCTEIGTAFQPAAGDYVSVGDGGVVYTVMSGVLDFTGSGWTLYVRRSSGLGR